ncbi:MAG TPA: hypothetical protein VFS39_12280 [Nitrospira sp.]|nr:hypothetical protein [Nitrospira sp.]
MESVGHAGGEFGKAQAIDGLRVQYSLEADGEFALLDVQWADWDRGGRLLVATRTGTLQVRQVSAGVGRILFEQDLAQLDPSPVPAPDWATHW